MHSLAPANKACHFHCLRCSAAPLPKLEHNLVSTRLTARALYSDVGQSLTADGTSADFARYISPALGTPANATNLAVQNQCIATTVALTGFPVNAPGFIGQIGTIHLRSSNRFDFRCL